MKILMLHEDRPLALTQAENPNSKDLIGIVEIPEKNVVELSGQG